MWSFRVTTPYEFFDRSRAYTLEGIAQRITCPVLVCQAAGEHFNPGQAEKLAAALGDRATVPSFTAVESAAYSLAHRRIRDHEPRRIGLDRAGAETAASESLPQ